ncbi:IucA/IucC family protein [Bacillus sp. CGMCC 1.16541]|uniref:IucA/IucC family protein n=1 Tax=Bacillus sp. CGMCC 1.16541 TaxID=2185143 RepID=UPI000D735D2C|nr:IucA/IucC family protein [Bacillus sp. CGMCC 1.16541]
MLQHLCSKTELRVKRQLLEAMLFEQLLPYDREGDTFRLYGSYGTYECKGKRGAFNRFRIQEECMYQIEKDGSLVEIALEQLVEELTSEQSTKARLLNELEQTIRLTEWNELNLAPPLGSRRELSYEELESEIIEGHPYHPCFKARTGFTISDHQRFGPEAKQSFALQWLAVRRKDINFSFPYEECDFWKNEVGEEAWNRFIIQLKQVDKQISDYTFLPVHPWQWSSLVKSKMLDQMLKNEDIIPLKYNGDLYRATQSVRTLWNDTQPEKAHVKLSMNMVNTSSLRTLASHSVCTAPHLSAWLNRIVEGDSYLHSSLILLKEYAGAIYEPKDEQVREKMDGQLGVIWRENIRTYMKEEEKAVPFTALPLLERDGELFITPWLRKYGIEKWIERFVEVAILPVWHLLVAHGVGVEAHAQNMVLLHEDGWPTRVVLRDFHESVEYVEFYLTSPAILPDFQRLHHSYKEAPNNQYYWMSSVEGLRELVMDTLFVFHLSDLSFALEAYEGYKEHLFWTRVHTSIEKHLERFPSLRERHEQLRMNQPRIYTESLLMKKVSAKKQESYRHLVVNTLAMI